MRRTAVLGFALTATLTVFTAGCSDSDGSSTPTTSSSTTPTTAVDTRSDADSEEQAVIDAYLAAIDAFYLAANPPDPDHPELTRRYGEPLLTNVQQFLKNLANEGVVLERGAATANHPRLRRLTGKRAELTDCLNDADIQRERDSRQVVNDEIVHAEFTAVLELREDTWVLIGRSETAKRATPC